MVYVTILTCLAIQAPSNAQESSEMIRGVRMARKDGYLHCQFLRKMNMSGDNRVYDLEKDWYLLLAQGSVRQGQ